MCQYHNKVCREAYVMQQSEHPIIMLMNYKRIFLTDFFKDIYSMTHLM